MSYAAVVLSQAYHIIYKDFDEFVEKLDIDPAGSVY